MVAVPHYLTGLSVRATKVKEKDTWTWEWCSISIDLYLPSSKVTIHRSPMQVA